MLGKRVRLLDRSKSLNYTSQIWETIRLQLIHGRCGKIISHELTGWMRRPPSSLIDV